MSLAERFAVWVDDLDFHSTSLSRPQRPSAPPERLLWQSGGHVFWLYPMPRCVPHHHAGDGGDQKSPGQRW